MQRSMLNFILKDSHFLARTVTKHSEIEMLSGFIEQSVVMVNLFQHQKGIRGWKNTYVDKLLSINKTRRAYPILALTIGDLGLGLD